MGTSARQLASDTSQGRNSGRIGLTPLPWLLALPVLALAAWLLADVVHRIVAEQNRDLPTLSPSGFDPAPDLLPGAGADPSGEMDSDLTSLWPPPGSSMPERDPQDPPQGPWSGLPDSTVKASLVGTITTSDPGWSLALIANQGEPRAAPHRIGDRLAEGVRLVAIHADRVVLENAGRREVLWLAETDRGPAGVVVAAAEPLASPAGAVWIQRLGPDGYRLDKDRFAEILAHPEQLAREARITLSFGAEGKVDGIRLAGIRPHGILAQLGLARSDVIRRVNGAPIDGPDRMLEIIAGLRAAREIELQISSRGRDRTLRYRID